MKKLIFATGNPNKVREANLLLNNDQKYRVFSLKDMNITEDLAETGSSLTENAIQKAVYIHENYNYDCFSEDTGLEVEALNGEPGIYSARYAGPQRDDDDNIDLLLEKLKDQTNRKARFRTIICLILSGEQFTFEGITNGTIVHNRTGSGGFGYDPVFVPEGFTKSFAEMSKDEKTLISHRGKAIRKLIDFLETI